MLLFPVREQEWCNVFAASPFVRSNVIDEILILHTGGERCMEKQAVGKGGVCEFEDRRGRKSKGATGL